MTTTVNCSMCRGAMEPPVPVCARRNATSDMSSAVTMSRRALSSGTPAAPLAARFVVGHAITADGAGLDEINLPPIDTPQIAPRLKMICLEVAQYGASESTI
jgi:hypothetical protein